MAVRFITGRAGTGKTHYCLTSIREALAQSPCDGPSLVLLVPEQASLQMERALLAGPIYATHRAEVLSFQRLAFRVLQAAGSAERQALSSGARAMVLRTLLQDLAPNLRYYRRVDRLTGFLEQLGRSVSELIEEAVEPEELRRAASEPELDPQRAAKLADLADVYQAYLVYLGASRLDASQYLGLARDALPRCDYLQGARFWVDGFAGFTRQELRLLTDLAHRGTQTEITVLVDPDYHTAAANLSQIHAADLFAKPQRTYVTLRQRFRDAGLDVAPPLELRPPHSAPFRAVQRPPPPGAKVFPRALTK